MAEKVLIPIEIPVKPIVRGYLEYTFGRNLRIYQNSPPGILLKSMLEKPKADRNHECMPLEYDQEVTIYIDQWDMEYYGYQLSKTQIRRFNSAIAYQVYELLFCRLDALQKYQLKKGYMKREIMDFMEEYNLINYGLNYEACKKQYQRHRQDRKKKYKELQINLLFQ